MTHQWLVLNLDAPLMAFGGVAVDQVGPTRDFPAASMLTGLFGNALGWHWSDRQAHQSLQDRLVFASRRDCEGTAITDSQNVQLSKLDKGWTTRGRPEGRAGASYSAPHRRQRDYHADSSVCVVLRLEPARDKPVLEELAAALERPARPLFLGRKPCLPSAPLLKGKSGRWVVADKAYSALAAIPGKDAALRAQWPIGEGPESPGNLVDHIVDHTDLRNWLTGLHGGSRRVVEGRIIPADA